MRISAKIAIKISIKYTVISKNDRSNRIQKKSRHHVTRSLTETVSKNFVEETISNGQTETHSVAKMRHNFL